MTMTVDFSVHLNEEDKQAVALFWAVYKAHFDEISAQIAAAVAANSEYRVLYNMGTNQQPQGSNQERLESALGQGHWQPYLDYLMSVGSYYAVTNVRLATWFSLLHRIRAIMSPWLVQTYMDTPDQLIQSLNGMSKYLEISMAAISEAYMQTKEQVILKQREAILELSISMAFNS